MKKLFAVAAVLVGAAAMPAQAEIIDVSIGDNVVRAAIYGPLARIFSSTKGQYDVGIILRPKTSDDLLVTHIGALLTGDAGMKEANLAAGLGIRGVYVGRDHDSGGALALGGQAEIRFPGYDRLGFSIYGYGAPKVTSFGEVNNYYEIGTGLDYQLLKDASIYVGYRQVKMDIGANGKVTADDSPHLGVRLNF